MNTGTHEQPLVIDGSLGEGGGQVLRTALGLSLVTGRPFRMENIRALRRKPGLMRQHLTAVLAAAEIGSAKIEGAHIGSTELDFAPSALRGGDYHLAVGTAGSTTLVLQAILPGLLHADVGSTVEIGGGTHNPMSPPYDFLERAFLPLLNRMGAQVSCQLERPGFFPAGGGLLKIAVTPCDSWKPLHLEERGDIQRKHARALVANLPTSIARRELSVISRRLGLAETDVDIEECPDSHGPGNACIVEVASTNVTEVFVAFGQTGRRAESVAQGVCKEARAYLASGVPVGPHLADQLLIPLALAGGGSFRTMTPTDHTLTNAQIVQAFLPVALHMEQLADRSWKISVAPR